jgi:hypothetical protein
MWEPRQLTTLWAFTACYRGSFTSSFLLQLQSIIAADNQWLSKTRSIPYWTTSVFSSAVTNDERRITCDWSHWTEPSNLSLSLVLRPTVSRPVCLGIKHPSGAYDQIIVIVWQLRVSWFGAPSLTRGRVCRLQLLLVLASAVIFGSESLGTWDHILLSHIRDFPFLRLLRLAGSRWRYSIPPPHGAGGIRPRVPL